MLERYRTLGAMLALREFTVSDLVLLSGVTPATVRTVLGRERELVERVASVPTGRRGGQPHRWRLVAEAPERLRDELKELESAGAGPWLGEASSDAQAIPGGIVAAENTLLHLLPQVSEADERVELIDLAQSQLDTANAVMSSASQPVATRISNHKRIVELLLDLERAEQALQEHQDFQAYRKLQQLITELRLVAEKIDNNDVMRALSPRLASSLQLSEVSEASMLAVAAPFEETEVRRSRHNLPIQPNKFIGRQRELADLTAKLGNTRMLTLWGPGGIGKTRLAHNLASEVVAEFADGAWLVELADVIASGPVTRLVASTLGIKEEPGRKAADTLADALQSRHMLLVLDSCETSISASAELAKQLLAKCPSICILTTSRQPLGVLGEEVWKVPPLSTRDQHYMSSTAALPRSEAMRLFTERALDAMPSFSFDRLLTVNAIAQLCRALDGMPLSIELAAAQVRALPVEQIEIGLTMKVNSIDLPGNSVSGQRELMAAVDWSYEMLSEQEQILFRRLSVFAGWYLDMAEEICGGDDLPSGKISALLADLVDKSLVTLDHEVAGEARYGMHDTIRDYAKERLVESGELLPISIRHRDHLLRKIEEIVSVEFGSSGPTWHERVSMYRRSYAERENYTAALWLSLERRNVAEGLRFCSALRGIWIVRGEVGEGADWFDRFLTLDDEIPLALRSTALVMRAELAFEQLDYPTATEHADAALDLCLSAGIARPPGALRVLSLVGLRTGPLKKALKQAEKAVREAQETGDEWEEGLALNSSAAILSRMGFFQKSQSSYEQALEVLRDNNGWGVAQILFGLGELARKQRDPTSASHYFTESLALYRDIDARPEISRCMAGIGWVALSVGDLELASSSLKESLELNVAMGQRLAIARGLEAFAILSMRQNDFARAIQLQGAAFELRDTLGHRPSARGQERVEELLETAHRRLGSPSVERLLSEGRALTLQSAAQLALSGAQSRPRRIVGSESITLTPAEHRIANLISHGLSTRAIAAELFISPTAVGRYVASILAKLGLVSRSQIAAWARASSEHVA